MLTRMKIKSLLVVAFLVSFRAFAADPAAPATLQFDAESKSYAAKVGEAEAPFTFYATNVSSEPITINKVVLTCGCTTAQLPSMPYVLGAGSNVAINTRMNLAGKQGAVTKSIKLDTTAGVRSLLVNVTVPVATETN